MVQDRAILSQCQTNSKSYVIYRMAPYSATLNVPYPGFQVISPGFHRPLMLNISEMVRDADIVSIEC